MDRTFDHRHIVRIGDALESGVMEGEHVMGVSVEVFWSVMGVDGIHSFQPTEPRRVRYLKCSVRLQAPAGKWMTFKRFVVGGTECQSVAPAEPDERIIVPVWG